MLGTSTDPPDAKQVAGLALESTNIARSAGVSRLMLSLSSA
jgi:hypothetical protein